MIPVVPAITSAALCERRRLVDLKGATFLRGKSLRAMQLLAEGGDRREARDEVFEPGLEWVWNVALNPAGGRRDLRFWPPC